MRTIILALIAICLLIQDGIVLPEIISSSSIPLWAIIIAIILNLTITIVILYNAFNYILKWKRR